MKKILALVLAVMMLMAMSMSALADDEPSTPSITIKPNNVVSETKDLAIDYTWYRILEASIDTDPSVKEDGTTQTPGTAAYYVTTAERASLLEDTGLFNVTQVDGQETWYVELKDTSTTADQIVTAFSADAFDLTKFASGTFNKEIGEEDARSGELDAGYYYIQSSLGTKIAVQTLTAVTINEKNTYPGVTKTDDKEFAAIDDTVTYTVVVTIPATVAEKDIVIYDTITEGLTLDTTVEVANAADEPEYTTANFVENTDYQATDNEKQYTITIPAATVIANKGKTLTFTYTAKVNDKAVVLEKETNSAYLKYDNFTTVEVETDVTTLAFDLQKVDGNDKDTILAGAKFKLYDAATEGSEIKVVFVETDETDSAHPVNVYRVAKEGETGVEIEAGTARIEGLDNKTYYLEETEAPTGYNKLENRVAVEVDKETATTDIDLKVENNKGTTLPSTGGIGTTLFYVIGGVLVAAAVVLLVTKKRMSAME